MAVYSLTAGLVIGTGPLLEELKAQLQAHSVRVMLEHSSLSEVENMSEKLRQAPVDILFLDVHPFADRINEVLRALKADPACPLLIAVHNAAEPSLILAAMRAGANEFLYPPLGEHLPPALDRLVAARREQYTPRTAGGRTLGFFSAKGGCGATTIACHVAVELQRQTQHKILLTDLDIDTGMIRFYMKAKSSYSVLDAIANIHRLDVNFWGALISNGMPRLEVISAPAPSGSTEISDRDALQHVIRFARSRYDLVLVDLGRSLNTGTMTALEEIDEAFLVTTLDVPALYRGKQLVQTLLESGFRAPRLHVLVNRMPRRPEVTLDEVERMLGVPVYGILPNDYPGLYEAYAGGTLLPRTTPLGVGFSRLAAKIAGIPEPKKSRFSLFG